jgi:hypothetical protein
MVGAGQFWDVKEQDGAGPITDSGGITVNC